ncbi:MAG: substrate-binding domain-containing protein, partial [Clostridia bacterium]|nr:substrate-binding domain-containing protein [Clostridia bacterium]
TSTSDSQAESSTPAGTVANVRSSVISGSYTSARSVILTSATSGATIYYTTNSSTPTASSTRYTGAIKVSSTTTIKAIAIKSGLVSSSVATFIFTINIPVILTGNIVCRGSSALYPLVQLATDPFANKFSSQFSGTIDTGSGEGSGAGLDALSAGTSGCNIGDSDVTPEQTGSRNSSGLTDHVVATVGVAVVVNSDVYTAFAGKGIKISDVKKIYEHQITNWNQVANCSLNENITVVYRKNGSGTRVLFQTYGIIGTTFTDTLASSYNTAGPNAFIIEANSDQLAGEVGSVKGSVGYETLPYCGGLKKLPVIFDLNSNGSTNSSTTPVAASYTNINNGLYKIWGYEHMYTKSTISSNSAALAFIQYMTSADFQSTIISNGYGLVSNLSSAAKSGH